MKNRIVLKFFGAFSVLILIVVFVLNFFVSIKLHEHFEQKISAELKSNAVLVGDILQTDLNEGLSEKIQHKTKQLADKLDLRITVIEKDGRILGDSEQQPSSMENHSDRLEIIEAIETGFGQSTRFSDTLGINMKYVAVRVDQGDRILGVVRFALPLSRVQPEIRIIYRVVLFGTIAAVIIALIAAYFVSRSITLPIRQVKETARQIARGDFSKRVRIKSKGELGELAESLNTMADELQQKMENLNRLDRIRTDFVANVSHELKTPLTLIKGYIETLQNKAINDKEKSAKFISIIKEHSDRLGYIIDDLLSLSEIELSRDCVNKTKLDLKEVIDEISLGFEQALAEKHQSLTVSTQGDDFSIQADRNKIEQVFANLIDNSIKYTKESGRIEISLYEQAQTVCVNIQDNGIGIPKEHRDRVFERFYRVDKARSRELGGTGLGLSIVKHIVLAHNGIIAIESEPNKGTKVSVTFPKN
jgi:two-component system phosphate regulon sensor histidine kinase PhoR